MDEPAPTHIRIRNWNRYQHYKHRRPPWIKVYIDLLSDEGYEGLSDASKLLALSLLLLAGLKDNRIPNDPGWIQKHASLSQTPNLTPLVKWGMLEFCPQDASTVLAPRKQSAMPETETETETEAETEPPPPPLGERRARVREAFKTFWEAYPRKADKKRTLTRWLALAPPAALVTTILTALEEAKRGDQWTRDGGRFIPLPSTWLNGRRWEDVPSDNGQGSKEPGSAAELLALTKARYERDGRPWGNNK